MKITRWGSAAYHGKSSVEFRAPKIAWSKSDSCLMINQSNVKDFNGPSRHGYEVCITASELNSLFQAISDAAISDPAILEKLLEPSLKALVRIQAVAAGLKS